MSSGQPELIAAHNCNTGLLTNTLITIIITIIIIIIILGLFYFISWIGIFDGRDVQVERELANKDGHGLIFGT